ncbi:MAG: aspartyl-tRNA(Asn)/glutamyl-tRNA(Gln) amidotransferase subunit [Rhodospirillaceae bacterium]|jgi:aspartyl-tRNA(Asn)/glutamyl-tRNA(Gln) amidotransferase subunit C|nr:aspartyl-tRNA(Asn)/glutamyl-tRNA(Gln) amidotransferase subunit [Rhodospirillaceae bacterium]
MSLDRAAVRHIATLARIRVSDAEADALVGELGNILAWVEQLGEVDTSGVEPMASVVARQLPRRRDEVTDGNIRDQILANAPEAAMGFFTVPKVVE